MNDLGIPVTTQNVFIRGAGWCAVVAGAILVTVALSNYNMRDAPALLWLAMSGGVSMALFGVLILAIRPPDPSPDMLKVCPECAEPVRAAARVCRYCSHRFEPLASTVTQ